MTQTNTRISAAWIVPLVVLVIVVWVFFDALNGQGVRVRIDFRDGHGLATGDVVRCRGIEVGVVEQVLLEQDGVEVVVALQPAAAERIAREGARWWVSRPQIDWSRVSGLDSLVGPRFVMVDPPGEDAPASRTFTGMAEAPVIEHASADSLSIILTADDRGTLQSGSAVLYRGIRIGTIQATALAPDATGVEVSAIIESRYAPLVRSNSRFYQTGALDLDVGLTGLRARLDSLETLFVGGVTLVTPTKPGEEVESGDRFAVYESAQDDWLEWKPKIDLQ